MVRSAAAGRPPASVAVDLTPVLPGGENGGAKGFALDLVRRLATGHPATQFVLLTQAASHDELAELDAPNVRRMLTVGEASSSARPALARMAGAIVRVLPAPARRAFASAAFAAYRLMKRRGAQAGLRSLGVELLYCPFTAPTYREPGLALVCTVYDLQHRAYPQFFSPEDVLHREHVVREAGRHAHAIAAISHFTRDAFVAAGLAPNERVHAVPLQVSAPASANTRARESFLLYPANLWRHKNHELLLTAFGMAIRKGLPGDVQLVCTGFGGARAQELSAVVNRMGLGSRVSLRGFVAPAELHSLMAQARALVFPSLYEGFGLPVAEAMAMGTPVACSDGTALREVAGEAALLFDARKPEALADAIVHISTDEALRTRLAAAGREHVRAYTDPQAMADRYWALFAEALAR